MFTAYCLGHDIAPNTNDIPLILPNEVWRPFLCAAYDYATVWGFIYKAAIAQLSPYSAHISPYVRPTVTHSAPYLRPIVPNRQTFTAFFDRQKAEIKQGTSGQC